MPPKKQKVISDQRPFTIVYNDFLDSDRLNANEKMVYICIKRYLDNVTHTAFPSIKTICEVTGISKPTVNKALKS